jgi:hypothetical protein
MASLEVGKMTPDKRLTADLLQQRLNHDNGVIAGVEQRHDAFGAFFALVAIGHPS